ncbi:putative flap endonuclease-1-like 5' DNA nuclease [Lewinella marina]|uniref:Uncharacterized protein n=1 Tax=Neolewinella marina TaxID=438751 RepID=A0A2G0CH24_9BACT|nr:hypothetical protein [Neolewinella marina]NJB86241.1 putative flap endonuclease-1-like 5' DNA nuclease [Neolewinella marina]PHK99285.1 hypothetical protein CGL56_07470 [Neolewinella marina]
MASLKKELRAVLARFEAAQEAFIEGTKQQQQNKKKLKGSKAKIKSLEQKVASLEQQLQMVLNQQDVVVDSTAAPLETTPKPSTPKRSGSRRGSKKKDTTTTVSAEEMAQAVSDAPDSVSEAAAEKPAPKSRRGRPRKTTGAAKSARKSTSATKRKSTGTRGRGRPSTKAPDSVLTKISGVGVTMAKRFEESGVTSIEQFAKLSDDEMKEVLQKCGPRYRNADSEKMESYRENARQAMEG